MKVYIFTRQDIEKMLEENSYPENTVMIEIYDYFDEKPEDHHSFNDKLLKIGGNMISFPLYDIDIDELPEYDLTEDTYFSNSDRVASFIKRAYRQNYDIVCFSETGTSRSSACAAAILEYCYGNGMSVFKDCRYNPNKLVYSNLLKALRNKEKMYMNVDIYSRKAVEELLEKGFPENTAVISFYDPPNKRTGEVTKPVDYQGKAERVFYIPIYDIDIEVLPEFDLTYDTYFPEADSLAEFIERAVDDSLNIICQCEYGQSRSAACAAAILEYYFYSGIDVFSDYRYYPNQLIYNKVLNALKNKIDVDCRVKKEVYPNYLKRGKNMEVSQEILDFLTGVHGDRGTPEKRKEKIFDRAFELAYMDMATHTVAYTEDAKKLYVGGDIKLCNDNKMKIKSAIKEFVKENIFGDVNLSKLLKKISSEDKFKKWHKSACISFVGINCEVKDLELDQEENKIADPQNIRKLLCHTDRNLEYDGVFTYGQAQKLINMMLKYLYIFYKCEGCNNLDILEKFAHVPIDRYVLKAVFGKEDYNGTPWSKITLYKVYKECKKEIDDEAKASGYPSPFLWELANWPFNNYKSVRFEINVPKA